MGQGKILADNLVLGKSGTGVAFTDTGVAWIAFGTHYLSADKSVADVRLCAKAFYSWCIATEYPDVVEHCRLNNKLAVHLQFGMGITNTHSTLHYERAVSYENPAELIVRRIIFVYNRAYPSPPA